MKRGVLLVFMLVVSTAIWADNYTYHFFVFTDRNGQQTVVSVDDLQITYSNEYLVAKNAYGITTLSLIDLASMSFCTTSDVSACIPNTHSRQLLGSDILYDLTGRCIVRSSVNDLKTGIYIVRRSNGSTSKIIVK